MKVQLPWIGKAAGSSAGTIYQTYWGNTYSRSFPALFHYPDTKKQQECQASFFDIQRIWLPIYNEISTHIGKMQRKNKNPFNKLTSSIYHIFNPYDKESHVKVPENFGLDPLNRVYGILRNCDIKIEDKTVKVQFTWLRPYINISEPITTAHYILFNTTLVSMYYASYPLDGSMEEITFENGNQWNKEDEIYFYLALSGETWLGNFNLQAEWLP